MATQVLAVAAGGTSSSDITLADGESATFSLKDASTDGVPPRGARVYIELKDDAGLYWTVETLTVSKPMTVIAAKGTFRLRRHDNGIVVGAFRG